MIQKQNLKNYLFIFITILAIFLIGRAQQVTDSRFTILLSHALYTDFSNDIKPYLDFPKLSGFVKELQNKYDSNGNTVEVNQIVRQNINAENEKWTMRYSQIPSILSLPFVIILDNIGFSVTTGSPPIYFQPNEITQQVIIASIICALYAVVLFKIAGLWLPTKFAIIATVILTLGSGVASTLSRAIWSDTWGCFLTLLAIHHLCFCQKNGTKLNPAYVVILTAIAVFCKPLYLFSAIAVTVWAFFIDKKKTATLIVIASISAILYLLWAYLLNKSFVTTYSLDSFPGFNLDYLLGVLFSPSRGMFVFLPWLFFLILAFCFTYKKIAHEDKTILKISILPIVLLLGLLSFYSFWWAGFAYGARLQTPTLPWLSLIAMILLSAFIKQIPIKIKNGINHYHFTSKQKALTAIGVFSSILAIFINIYGINQTKAFYDWHLNIKYDPIKHKNVDEAILKRMWDWTDPVFLAGIIKPERYLKDITTPSLEK